MVSPCTHAIASFAPAIKVSASACDTLPCAASVATLSRKLVRFAMASWFLPCANLLCELSSLPLRPAWSLAAFCPTKVVASVWVLRVSIWALHSSAAVCAKADAAMIPKTLPQRPKRPAAVDASSLLLPYGCAFAPYDYVMRGWTYRLTRWIALPPS